MDIVITYVDGNDPVWQADYEKFAEVPVLAKRFRDWGTLKYLLRGVEQHMPFVRKAHLVVSHISQVPDWVDTDNVNVVLHKDIIPEDYLPNPVPNPRTGVPPAGRTESGIQNPVPQCKRPFLRFHPSPGP